VEAEPAPGCCALRIVVFDAPVLRAEKGAEDQMLAGPAALAAVVFVLLCAFQCFFAPRFPGAPIGFDRVVDRIVAYALPTTSS